MHNPAPAPGSPKNRTACALSDNAAGRQVGAPQGRALRRFVVLDFETTGLSPTGGARIIEVSAREVLGERLGRELLTFVDPGIEIPPVVTALTGIDTRMVSGAPRANVVVRELLRFIGSSPVVGHNIAFDLRFLDCEANELCLETEIRSLCTLLLARRVYPRKASYKLGSIATTIGIQVPERLHRARADTLVTAALFSAIRESAQRRCGPKAVDYELLAGLQKVKIASAHEWLGKQAVAR